ncbi:MAG: ECF-type sigma factor [Planctomycetota bacterium]
MGDVTQMLQRASAGDRAAANELLVAVYDELRRLAAHRLAGERPGQTLEPTALVHEAYLRLVGDEQARWENRRHFFAAAAESMRRILVEAARRKGRVRHGGGLQRQELAESPAAPTAMGAVDLLTLDEALAELAGLDPIKAKLVELRYFGGLTLEQAGELLDLSRATADRYWRFARAWLYQRLRTAEEA